MTSENAESMNAGTEGLAFEDAYRQLTEIAEQLEAGGLTLAEATAKYEEGMRLVQYCNRLLDSAELEITTLRENYQRPSTPATEQDGPEPPFFDEIVEEEDDLPF